MSTTATQPAAPPQVHGLKALGVFVGVGVVALAAALVAGATGLFNVLVFLVFGVLWLSFAGALVFAPADLDALWCNYRERNVVVQALGWLLFLPLTAALFIWERRWQVALRSGLVLAIAALNLFMFFPRG
jgi:succinate-acetate transporter protein